MPTVSPTPAPQTAAPAPGRHRKALARKVLASEAETAAEAKLADVARRFSFLEPGARRDAASRAPGEAGYDARTLAVPPAVRAALSPSQQQYWAIKSRYADVLLFFKVGAFKAWVDKRPHPPPHPPPHPHHAPTPHSNPAPQVGTFYELYEADAAIAADVLGWAMTVSG